MFCPKCGVEFREGFSMCSDCHVELVAELPPESKPPSEPGPRSRAAAPDDPIVTVWETFDPGALALAKSILDSAGVRYCVNGEHFTRLASYSSPLLGYNPVFGGYRVQVVSSDAAETVELLREVTERLFLDEDP